VGFDDRSSQLERTASFEIDVSDTKVSRTDDAVSRAAQVLPSSHSHKIPYESIEPFKLSTSIWWIRHEQLNRMPYYELVPNWVYKLVSEPATPQLKDILIDGGATVQQITELGVNGEQIRMLQWSTMHIPMISSLYFMPDCNIGGVTDKDFDPAPLLTMFESMCRDHHIFMCSLHDECRAFAFMYHVVIKFEVDDEADNDNEVQPKLQPKLQPATTIDRCDFDKLMNDEVFHVLKQGVLSSEEHNYCSWWTAAEAYYTSTSAAAAEDGDKRADVKSRRPQTEEDSASSQDLDGIARVHHAAVTAAAAAAAADVDVVNSVPTRAAMRTTPSIQLPESFKTWIVTMPHLDVTSVTFQEYERIASAASSIPLSGSLYIRPGDTVTQVSVMVGDVVIGELVWRNGRIPVISSLYFLPYTDRLTVTSMTKEDTGRISTMVESMCGDHNIFICFLHKSSRAFAFMYEVQPHTENQTGPELRTIDSASFRHLMTDEVYAVLKRGVLPTQKLNFEAWWNAAKEYFYSMSISVPGV